MQALGDPWLRAPGKLFLSAILAVALAACGAKAGGGGAPAGGTDGGTDGGTLGGTDGGTDGGTTGSINGPGVYGGEPGQPAEVRAVLDPDAEGVPPPGPAPAFLPF